MQTTEAQADTLPKRKLGLVITFLLENMDKLPLNPLMRMPIAAMGQVFLLRLNDLSAESFNELADQFSVFTHMLTSESVTEAELIAYLTDKLPK